jgi:putative component of membrane protein insertase Oxa1/YidC/SpoIIIJ protein YidD
MMTMLQISRCNPFENIAPDLHPKEETLPEDKLANSNVFCNQMYLEEL